MADHRRSSADNKRNRAKKKALELLKEKNEKPVLTKVIYLGVEVEAIRFGSL